MSRSKNLCWISQLIFFGCNSKPMFTAWWARVGNYFKYYKTTYVKAMDKIAFVGHRMSENTEE